MVSYISLIHLADSHACRHHMCTQAGRYDIALLLVESAADVNKVRTLARLEGPVCPSPGTPTPYLFTSDVDQVRPLARLEMPFTR